MALLASRAQRVNKMAASIRLYLLFVLNIAIASTLESFSTIDSCGLGEDAEEKFFLMFEEIPETLKVGEIVGIRHIKGFGLTFTVLDNEYVAAEITNSTLTVTLLKPLSIYLEDAISSGLEIDFSLSCRTKSYSHTTSQSLMVIDVLDENNLAPQFEMNEYPPYKVDWDEYEGETSNLQSFDKPMSQLIKVFDRDFLAENANISISVSCQDDEPCADYVKTTIIPISDSESEQVNTKVPVGDIIPRYLYNIQLELLPGIPEKSVTNKSWHINLTAFDGVNSNSTYFEIQFLQQKQTISQVEPEPEIGSNMNTYIIAAVIVGASVLGLAGARYLWRRKQTAELNRITDEEIREFREGIKNLSMKRDSLAINVPVLTRPYNNQFEIRREDLKIDETTTLGSGVYGTVMKGKVTINHVTTDVAVKTVKKNADVRKNVNCVKSLFTEIKIMTFIGKHPNIVNLIGACTQNPRKQIFVAVELCENGTLRNYLKNNRTSFADMINALGKLELRKNSLESVMSGKIQNLYNQTITTIDLVRWSHQVANGLEFIASKQVIHGDLAARNILLDSNRVCKIADFGLSSRLSDYTKQNYTKTTQSQLPWKHMAIESLKDQKFSLQTDIWTFGVLLWEIFTLGQNPFSIYTYEESFIAKLEAGLRLELPKYATKEIRKIMSDCWKAAPIDRPSICNIKRQLGEVLQNTGDYTSFMDADEGYSGSVRSTRSLWTSINLSHITQPPVIPERPDNDVLY